VLAAAWLWFSTSLVACEAWSGRSELQVEGATPYVRCLADEPPADGVSRIGSGVRIRTTQGEITVEGLRAPVMLAAFSGAGFAAPPGKAALDALAAAHPQLLLMLGGVGDTDAIATTTLAALANLRAPILILAGGRDSHGRIERAREGLPKEAAERITDVTSASSVRIGNDTFVPVAGALEGRYALRADACGYGKADLGARLADAPSRGGRRWLLAWQAPTGDGEFAVTHSDEGLDLGSAPLAELAHELGAGGGLFAWPEVQVLRPSAAGGHLRAALGVPYPDLQLVVPRLAGPVIERSDGSRVGPGFALLRLDAKGLTLVAAPVLP
jgi:hypothetical protein